MKTTILELLQTQDSRSSLVNESSNPLLLSVHLTPFEDSLLRDPSPGFPPSFQQGNEIQLFTSPLLWFVTTTQQDGSWQTSKRNLRPEGDKKTTVNKIYPVLPSQFSTCTSPHVNMNLGHHCPKGGAEAGKNKIFYSPKEITTANSIKMYA